KGHGNHDCRVEKSRSGPFQLNRQSGQVLFQTATAATAAEQIRMTQEESRMTNDEKITNTQLPKHPKTHSPSVLAHWVFGYLGVSSFELLSSFAIRHSSFAHVD